MQTLLHSVPGLIQVFDRMITGCLQDLSYESCLESHSSAAMCVVNDSSHTWTYAFLILRFFCICFLNIVFFWCSFSSCTLSLCLHCPFQPVLQSSHPVCHRNPYILLQYPLFLQTLQQPGFPLIHTLHFVCRWSGQVRFVWSCFVLYSVLLKIKRRKLVLKVFLHLFFDSAPPWCRGSAN